MATSVPELEALAVQVAVLEDQFAVSCQAAETAGAWDGGGGFEGRSAIEDRNAAVRAAIALEGALEPLRQRLLSLSSRGLL